MDTHDEEARVQAFYEEIDENNRLTGKSGQVEFLTTIRTIEKHLQKGMKILEVGAATGVYSSYFADLGFDVTAFELSPKNIEVMKGNMNEKYPFEIVQGNAKDMSMFETNSFDIVLCFGPLYHLKELDDQMICVSEVQRVLKKQGTSFYAFISNDMVIATMTMAYDLHYITGDLYDHKTFKSEDNVLIFSTLEDARKLLDTCKVKMIAEVGVDGLSEVLADKINQFTEEEYKAWLNYHFYCSEKPEMIGHSSHFLIVGQEGVK